MSEQMELFTDNDEPVPEIITPSDELIPGCYIEDRTYTGMHTAAVALYDSTYSRCTFKNCVFNKTDFTNTTFQDCTFENSELLLCKIDGTALDTVHFISCKLTGINFTEAADFGFAPDFSDCLLDSCVFYENNLNDMRFLNTTLRNTDFTNCMVKGTDFAGTRFQSTFFLGCHLEKSDFRLATGYSIDPAANKLKDALFSLPEAASFLKYLGITVE